MRRVLGTMYIITPEARLVSSGNSLVVKIGMEEIDRIPANLVEKVVCFCYAGLTPKVMETCVNNGIDVSFHSPGGRYLASLHGEPRGNVLLRKKQYRASEDPDRTLEISKMFVKGKIINSRSVLRRALRDHACLDGHLLERVSDKLLSSLESVENIEDIESLRGVEGSAAKEYFEVLDDLILKNKGTFFFSHRNRRPPRDCFNALLSFTYAMATNSVRSALLSVGLDPYVGFLHTDRPGRPALALDMVEELRPALADRFALSIVNLEILTERDFSTNANGEVSLNDKGRRKTIEAWHDRMRKEAKHPYTGEGMEKMLIPHMQARLMAMHLRGDLDGYPPYLV